MKSESESKFFFISFFASVSTKNFLVFYDLILNQVLEMFSQPNQADDYSR